MGVLFLYVILNGVKNPLIDVDSNVLLLIKGFFAFAQNDNIVHIAWRTESPPH